MKPFLVVVAGLLLLAPDAGAQVTINQAALDQLAGVAPPALPAPENTARSIVRQLPRRIAYRRFLPRRNGARHFAGAAIVAKPAPPMAPAPKAQVEPVVARPAPPPVPKPVSIRFAAGGADLPGNSAAMLKPFCTRSGLIIIDAYATADPSDPSSAPRLSMRRAFAIRDALTACGVPSGNIIPRANGAAPVKNPDAAEISATP